MGLSNVENILEQALAGEPITIKPESRVEALLIALIETGGGGGGGGTTDYTQLSNKPQIAGTTLTGNKTLNELGIASKADLLKRMRPVLSMPSAITDGLVIFWCGQPTATFKTGAVYIYDGTSQQWLTMYEPAEIPESTSDLINDSGFITNTVNNLANYYIKSQTYTQAEVDALIAAAKNGRFISVATLPTTDIDTMAIYLVPSDDPEAGNVKDEYINLDGTSSGWESIGSTVIDLSGYVTDEELTAALADYTTTAILNSLLDGKVDKVTGKGLSKNDYTDADKAIVEGVTSALAGKQDTISDLATIRSGASAGSTSVQPSATTGLLKNDGTVDTVPKASQTDLSDSEKDIYAVMGEMGAKNLIPYPYSASTIGSGVTYTDNGDGSIKVNGTGGSNTNRYVLVSLSDNFTLKKGVEYILTDGCSDTGLNTYRVAIVLYNGDVFTNVSYYTSNGITKFTIPNDVTFNKASIYIAVNKDMQVNNVTMKPMIRLASDTDDTYQQYAKTNKQLTDEIANKVDKVEGKGLSTNDYDDTEKGKVADNTSTIEAMVNVNGFSFGRDLTVVFADEIADYSDEWAWIQARLDAHDVSGLRVGDYIPINIAANGGIAAETHKAEIAGINTYRRTGDSGHEVGYHIDWITRDCYSGTVKFNTTNINNGNANSPSPFLASNLKSWLDGTLYPLLDAKLKNVIKAKRILAPSRYQSGATLTDDNSWAWQDFDKLWVPLETEIFDCLAWSTKGYGNGQAVQYPIFANSYEHRMKGAGPGGARADWSTASARSGNSTYVVYVHAYGNSGNGHASNAFCVPVCFRTMEA